MSKTRIRKSIIYKKSEIVGIDEKRTLKRLIKEALKIKSKPSERRQNMGSDNIDSGVRRVIGSTSTKESMLFGSVLLYEIGKDVTFVVEDEDADEFVIESQNPSIGTSEEDKKRREVLQSALYFGVLGNHVVAVQSQALRSKDLESHLVWLLRESLVITEDVGISLSDEPTEKARKKLNELPVKSVEIGAPIESRAISPDKGSTALQTTASNHRLTGKAKEVIQAILGDSFISSLDLPADLNDSNLELVLQLRYKRKTTDSGHKALDLVRPETHRHFLW